MMIRLNLPMEKVIWKVKLIFFKIDNKVDNLGYWKARFQVIMMISYLIQHNILDETGFGIYSVTGDNFDLGEQTVIIDFVNKTVTDNVPVSWDKFVAAYSPLSV